MREGTPPKDVTFAGTPTLLNGRDDQRDSFGALHIIGFIPKSYGSTKGFKLHPSGSYPAGKL
jgi:hypothetical protein